MSLLFRSRLVSHCRRSVASFCRAASLDFGTFASGTTLRCTLTRSMPCGLCGVWAEGPEWVQFPPPRSIAHAWQLQGDSPIRFAYVKPGYRIWVCDCEDCLITDPQLLSLDGKVFGLCRRDSTLGLCSRFEVAFKNAQLRVGY